MGFPLSEPAGAPVVLPDADLVAQIPADIPVKLEYDVSLGQYRYAALSAAELKQRDVDQAAAAVQAEAEAAAQADQDALVAALEAGIATDVQVQQALAQVLS